MNENLELDILMSRELVPYRIHVFTGYRSSSWWNSRIAAYSGHYMYFLHREVVLGFETLEGLLLCRAMLLKEQNEY